MTPHDARVNLMSRYGKSIESLPTPFQETVCLRCAGYTNQDSADRQKIKLSSVAYRLKRAAALVPAIGELLQLLRTVPTCKRIDATHAQFLTPRESRPTFVLTGTGEKG